MIIGIFSSIVFCGILVFVLLTPIFIALAPTLAVLALLAVSSITAYLGAISISDAYDYCQIINKNYELTQKKVESAKQYLEQLYALKQEETGLMAIVDKRRRRKSRDETSACDERVHETKVEMHSTDRGSTQFAHGHISEQDALARASVFERYHNEERPGCIIPGAEREASLLFSRHAEIGNQDDSLVEEGANNQARVERSMKRNS